MNKLSFAVSLSVLVLLGGDLVGQAPQEKNSEQKVKVGAYYYPWYRARRGGSESVGWMRQAMRAHLQPRQLPALGVYDSRDPQVVAGHIAQSRRGNIDFWAVSWWGPDTVTDRTFRDAILTHPDAAKLEYALFYEPTGRLGSFDKPDYSHLLGDFQYMAERYFDHPRYLKINGKPVVFVYLTRVYFRNRGLEPLAELRQRLPNLYIVGDDVFGPRYQAEYAKLWDAVTAYDVYGQSTGIDGASRAALKRLNANYANARKLASSVGTGFIPAISPGYNDKAVRRGHAGRGRYFTDVENSREGDLFRAMIADVGLPNADPRAANIIMITSFNEWYEDTQIEATAGTSAPTTRDDSSSGEFYTEGEKYVDYGHLYLDILREATSGQRSP